MSYTSAPRVLHWRRGRQRQMCIKERTNELEEIVGDSHTEFHPGGDDRNINPINPVYAWRIFTAKSGRDYEIQVRPKVERGA